jgi:hypothetical protein
MGINAGTIEKHFLLVVFVEDDLIWECSTQNPMTHVQKNAVMTLAS